MGTAIAALVLTVGGTSAFAAGGRNYVDANGDGICDNRGNYCRFVIPTAMGCVTTMVQAAGMAAGTVDTAATAAAITAGNRSG